MHGCRNAAPEDRGGEEGDGHDSNGREAIVVDGQVVRQRPGQGLPEGDSCPHNKYCCHNQTDCGLHGGIVCCCITVAADPGKSQNDEGSSMGFGQHQPHISGSAACSASKGSACNICACTITLSHSLQGRHPGQSSGT